MGAENFELKPAQQCTETDHGHFGELLSEVFQGQSGVLARQQTWTPQQWNELEQEFTVRSGREERQDPGPYNKSFLDMAFGGDVYTLGQGTKNLTINGKRVETGSAQYTEAMAKMEKAEKGINFEAPSCPGGPKMGVYENLDQKH